MLVIAPAVKPLGYKIQLIGLASQVLQFKSTDAANNDSFLKR